MFGWFYQFNRVKLADDLYTTHLEEGVPPHPHSATFLVDSADRYALDNTGKFFITEES